MSRVLFVEFRRFERSRIDANDALMALMIAARLGRHALSLTEGSPHHLPEIFPTVPEIARLNRTVADAAGLIDDAEEHMTYMAIPYMLAIHSTLVVDALRMLRSDGKFPGKKDPGRIQLGELHEKFEKRSGVSLSEDWLRLFRFARELRNQLVHSGGIQGELQAQWTNLPETARDEWTRIATRAPRFGRSDDRIRIDTNELRAVLAVTKQLGDEVNLALQSALSRPYWLGAVVADARSHEPRLLHGGKVAQKLAGYARMNYGPLALSRQEFADAGY